MTEDFDSWATTTGLHESYTGTVKDAYFTFDENYNNGQSLLLKLEIQTTDPEIGEGGMVVEQWGTGPHWETSDKGKTVHRDDDKKAQFNANTGVGMLIGAIVDLGPEAIKALRDSGQAYEAAAWIGHKFDWRRKDFEMTRDGETTKYSRMLPEGFYGAQGVLTGGPTSSTADAQETPAQAPPAQAPAAAPAQAPAAAPPAAEAPVPVAATPEAAPAADAPPSDDIPTGDMPVAVKLKLKKLAKESASHDDFVEAAFTTVDGVNESMEDLLMDATPAGFYAVYHAK